MAETYIEMFQEKFYPEICSVAANQTIERFEEQKEEIAEDWKKEIRRYMEQLAVKQEEHKTGSIAETDISFLFTSIEDQPLFRIDSYGVGGRTFAESELTGYLRADWLVSGLDEFGEMLLAKAKQEKLQRYIRTAEIEVLKLRFVRSLLYYFALRFKYVIPDMLDLKSLAKVKKTENFILQIGEYMDWQKTIYAILPEADIFNCERGTELRFRNFPAIYYKNKEFLDLNLSHSKYVDCTFQESTINNCGMDDCTFDGCLFEDVKITDVQMAGCLFLHCTFRQVEFENTVFMKNCTEGEDPDYFEPAEFFGCTFADSRFIQCNMEGCFVTDCEVQGLEIENSNVEKSEFTNLEHIVWKQSVEEQDGIL